MDHIVQIKPSGYLLFVTEGESVLEAALRQGYEFPYSCGSGTCGTCMGKVLSGTFTYGDVEPYALDEAAENEDGAPDIEPRKGLWKHEEAQRNCSCRWRWWW